MGLAKYHWVAPFEVARSKLQLRTYRAQTMADNPRVGGSIPPLATTPTLMNRKRFQRHPRTIGGAVARAKETRPLLRVFCFRVVAGAIYVLTEVRFIS